MIRVLLIDDEPDLADLAKSFLEMFDKMEVSIALSAHEGLDMLKREHYDAMVSDYQMPKMNGIELLRAVRRDHPSMPFVLFTGKGREEVVIDALNSGADSYIQKGGEPVVQFTELEHRITSAVSRRRAESTLEETNHRLQAASSRYEALIAASNTGAWEYHSDNDFLWCSPEYFSMIGHDVNEYDISGNSNLDKVWTGLLHPDDRERATQAFAMYLADPKGMYEEYFRLRHREDRWIWVWSRGRTIMGLDGRPTNVTVGTHIDVTERMMAENSIKQSETRQKDIIDFLPDATLGIDLDGRVIIWNRAMEMMTGTPAKDMLGRGDRAYSIPFYGEARPQLMDVVLGRHLQIRSKYHNVDLEGESITAEAFCPGLHGGKGGWVFAKASPLHDREGNIIGAIESIRDITERKNALEELSRSQEALRSAMEISRIVNWQYSRVTDTYTFDDHFYALYGTSGKMEGDYRMSSRAYVEEFVHPDDRQMVAEENERALSNVDPGFRRQLEYRIVRRDGVVRSIIARYSVRLDAKAKIIGMQGANQDITERKCAEDALKESETRFRDLFERNAAVKLIIDPSTGKIVDANPAAASFYGWTQEQLTQMTIMDINTLPRMRIVQEMEQASIRERMHFEFKHRRADGSIRDVIVFSSKIDAKGKTLLYSIVQDMTEQRRIEAEHRKLARAVEYSPVCVVITDIEGNIEWVNPKFTELTGYSLLEARGKNPRILSTNEKSKEEYQELWETILAGRTWRGEFHNKGKNGEFYWESACIAPVLDDTGAIVNFVAVKEDITARKRIEAGSSNAIRIDPDDI